MLRDKTWDNRERVASFLQQKADFESKNAQGELVGFDIDLAKELCKRINTQCTFVENPLDALIPS
ncbi:transporter substrate-binding domain-containing protein, partial [Salmonella enterica subsp. enterica serovar Kentucky]|nr:transporter substrate-binding domain-containing protein [Salmonella enterica subsp. enterica serovar Kentucky]